MKARKIWFLVFLLLVSSFAFATTDDLFVSDIVSHWYLNDSYRPLESSFSEDFLTTTFKGVATDADWNTTYGNVSLNYNTSNQETILDSGVFLETVNSCGSYHAQSFTADYTGYVVNITDGTLTANFTIEDEVLVNAGSTYYVCRKDATDEIYITTSQANCLAENSIGNKQILNNLLLSEGAGSATEGNGYYYNGTWNNLLFNCNSGAARDWLLKVSLTRRYENSNSVYSTEIDSTSSNIYSATLDSSENVLSNTNIQYYMSANNGSNWETVIEGENHIFSNSGNVLLWRADLTTSDNLSTPVLKNISISFSDYNQIKTVSDIISGNNGTLFGKTFHVATVDGATLSNSSPVNSSLAQFGNYYEFDGVNDFITRSNPINVNNSFTVSMWVNPNNLPTSNTKLFEFSRNSAINSYIGGRFTSTSTVQWEMRDLDSSASTGTTKTISVDEYSHLTFVRNNNYFELYINGTLQANDSITGQDNFTSEVLGIGAIKFNGVWINFFNGSIDEVKIWNRALTTTEVQEEMASNAVANAEGIVAYYDFNEEIADNLSVAFDNNHLSTGARQSTLGLTEPSFAWDKGYNFDGVNDYVTMGDVIDNQNSLTLSAWVKYTHSGVQQVFVGKWDGSANEYIMYSASDGDLSCGYYGTIRDINSALFPKDEWVHIVCVMNTSKIQIYVNGVQERDATITETAFNTAAPLVIGARSNLADSFVNGTIADVRIYNKTLSEDEILTLYAGLKNITIITNSTGVSHNLQSWTIESPYGNYATTSNSATLAVPYGSILVNFTNAYGYANYVNYPLTITEAQDTYYIDIYNATNVFSFNDYAVDNAFTFLLQGYEYNQQATITGDLTYNITTGDYYASILNGSTTLVNYSISIDNTNTTNLSSFGLNYLYYQDAANSSPIVGKEVTITYPDATEITRTTDAEGKVVFLSAVNEAIQNGTYSFSIESVQGYETPFEFSQAFTVEQLPFNVTKSLARTSINVSIYYRVNGSVFDKDATVVIQSIGNFSTSNGTISFGDVAITPGTYTFQIYSTGYFTEQRKVTFTNQESIATSFYMLENDLNTSNTLKVNVLDIGQSKIANAEVNLLEYDEALLSYKSVSQCYTDSVGVCTFLIELNDKTYRVTATKTIDGNELTANSGDEGIIFRQDVVSGEAATFEQLEVTLILTYSQDFTFLDVNYLNYNISENFNSTTNISTAEVSFYRTDGADATVCIEFFILTGTTQTSALQKCVTGNAGVVTPDVPFQLNGSKEYRLDIYTVNSDGSTTILGRYYYKSSSSFQELLKSYGIVSPIILFGWVAIIAIALYSGVLPILVIAGVFLSIIEVALFPNYMIASGMVLKILILLQILYFGRKKEDFK